MDRERRIHTRMQGDAGDQGEVDESGHTGKRGVALLG